MIVKGESYILNLRETPSKQELLTALANADEQTFVDELRSQFDTMAQLVPAIDKLFQEQAGSRRK